MSLAIVNLLLSAIILTITTKPSQSVLRTWTGGTNALLTTPGAHCKGLILPARYQSIIYLAATTISELVLPETGSVSLQTGASLIFDETDKSCTHLFLQKTSTNRPENWDALPNRAVPYLDRIPCQWDDIYIPEGNPVGIDFAVHFLAKSLRMQNRQLPMNNDDNTIVRLGFDVRPSNQCTRETCVCQFSSYYVNHCEAYRQLLEEQHEGIDKHNEEVRAYWESLQMKDEAFCEGPIEVERGCGKICGATVVIRGRNDAVSKLRKKVEEILERQQRDGVDVDFYSGVILNKREGFVDKRLNVQVVIVDKMVENGGRDSLAVVERLEKELEADYLDGEYLYLIQTSGTPIIHDSFLKSGVGMLFFTFLLTILLFASIYVIFMTSFNNRFLRITGNVGPVLSARFNNLSHFQYSTDEEDAILSCREIDISLTTPMSTTTANSSSPMLPAAVGEGESIVANANIVALERRDREFDNPLYDYAKHDLHELVEVEDGCSRTENERRVKGSAKRKKLRKNSRHNSFEQLLQVDEDHDDGDVARGAGDGKRGAKVKMAHDGQQAIQRDRGNVEQVDDVEKVEKNRDSTHEMLKFIEKNMQQANQLDDQL